MNVASNLMLALGVVAVVICAVFVIVLLSLFIQERIEMLDCVRNGGYWLTQYSYGCSFRAG